MPQEPRSGGANIDIDIEEHDSTTVLSIAGNITELEADELSHTLDDLFESGNYDLILDLADVDFMSSTGLGQIMRAYRIAQQNGGFIKIAQVQPLVADVFRVTKLDKLLGVFDTVDEALEAE